MKNNKIKNYALALSELALDKKGEGLEQDKRVKRFLALLQKEGLASKAKEIVQMAQDYVLAKKGNKKITIETARKITAGQKKLLESIAKNGDIVKEKINPQIIAGVKIVVNDNKQFDGSLQKKLQNIF